MFTIFFNIFYCYRFPPTISQDC